MVSRISLIVGASMLLGAAITPVQPPTSRAEAAAAISRSASPSLKQPSFAREPIVVSLQIYGDVTWACWSGTMATSSDAYVADNDALGSVLGFTGEARLKPGLKAGYKMELQVQSAILERGDRGR